MSMGPMGAGGVSRLDLVLLVCRLDLDPGLMRWAREENDELESDEALPRRMPT